MIKRKKWYNKKVQKWTGRDMIEGSIVLSIITTALMAIPVIGVLIKENLD